MNWSGGNVRSTPSFAFLLLSHLSSTDSPAAAVRPAVAAALVAAGELTCRVTPAGEARGVFCGMGVCHDCVVVVDGVPARSCMTPVRDGMTVQVQPAAPLLVETKGALLDPFAIAPDVLVVGG